MRILRWVMVVLLLTTLVRAADQAAPAADGRTTFLATDLFLDMGGASLGAYQVEVNAPHSLLVGVEGGALAGFREAPIYDPAALSHGRVIVAAFHVGGASPQGRIRVARLHWQLPAGVDPAEITARLVVATDAAGNMLQPTLRVAPFAGDRP